MDVEKKTIKPEETKVIKTVTTLHFSKDKHAAEMVAVNNLARLTNRRAHDAVGTLLIQTQPHMDKLLAFCRNDLKLAI